MATSTQQSHQETFSEDLAVSELATAREDSLLATATADVEEKEEKDATQKHGVKSGHTLM